jgi:hypothetical protein
LLLDDFVPNTHDWTNPVYTPTHFDDSLGEHEQLGLHAVLDDVSASGATYLQLFVEHSADAIHWLRLMAPGIPYNTSGAQDMFADITLPLISSVRRLHRMCSRSGVALGGQPMLHHVRVRAHYNVPVTSANAHVRLYAVQRGFSLG